MESQSTALKALDGCKGPPSRLLDVFREVLLCQVAGMNGLTIAGALAADWSAVLGSLVQARDHLQKDGVRHTWLDGAIAIAESRTKVPIPEAYLRHGPAEPNEAVSDRTASWYIEGGKVAAVTCTRLLAAGVGFNCDTAGTGSSVARPEQWFQFTLGEKYAKELRPACAYDVPHYPNTTDRTAPVVASPTADRPRG